MGDNVSAAMCLRLPGPLDSSKKIVHVVFSCLVCSIAITLMIFVNYGGGGYYFFGHAAWNGKHIISTGLLSFGPDKIVCPALGFEHTDLGMGIELPILTQQQQQQQGHTVYSQNGSIGR